jgi:cob(I)alamin adenosyltransferase
MAGYVHIYTGDGKGKTTAALGLALRASGNGYRTFMAQFMKGMWYGELEALKDNWLIDIVQYGWEQCIRKDQVSETHKEITKNGLNQSFKKMVSGDYRIIILDEIIVAIWFGLITEDEVERFISEKPEEVELVLTGRKAAQALIAKADLVTDMQNIKHYFDQGIEARKGIEF